MEKFGGKEVRGHWAKDNKNIFYICMYKIVKSILKVKNKIHPLLTLDGDT